MSALQLAIALRRRELRVDAVTNAFVSRIRQRNPKLGAFVEDWPQRALSRAHDLDNAFTRGERVEGTFAGVPTAIKDTDPSRISFTRMGARACKYLWTPVDGPVAARVRRGGFNIIGKTATPEFALLPITETAIHPPCRNPHNLEYSSGGSSGGAAVAVADRMLPIAHASDAAGSIRIPAACCGVFGFKPSRKALPNVYWPLDHDHLCAINCESQTVEDSAAFLDVLMGRNYAPDVPPPDSLLAQSRLASERLRIRYCFHSRVCEVEPWVVQGVLETAALLRSLGHDVHEAAPMPMQLDDFLPVWQRMAASFPVVNDALTLPTTQWLRAQGRRVTQKQASALVERLSQDVLSWFGDVDVWLTPSVGPHPPRIGAHLEAGDAEAQFRALAPLGAFTAPFNITGQPAASLPVGRAPTRVPFGVQLVARAGADAQLLALCHSLEAVRPFDLPPSSELD